MPVCIEEIQEEIRRPSETFDGNLARVIIVQFLTGLCIPSEAMHLGLFLYFINTCAYKLVSCQASPVSGHDAQGYGLFYSKIPRRTMLTTLCTHNHTKLEIDHIAQH
jgi:hypothetical protein